MNPREFVSDSAVPVALQSVGNDPFPRDAVDVVVIGGGIIGAAATYYLAQAGYKVALVEKGFVGAEQSSRNWGWCRQQNRDERELPLIKASLDLWGSLNAELGEETGFRRNGLLYVTDSEREMETWRQWVQLAKNYDVRSEMLTSRQASDLSPNAKGSWLGGVNSPSDGHAEPALAAPAYANAARRLGATIHQSCAARGLSVTNGRTDGVVTEHGLIKADAVLCANGAWASMFCRPYGVFMPQTGAVGTVFTTSEAPEIISGGFSTPEFTFRRNIDRTYTVSIRGRAQIDITPQTFQYLPDFWGMFRDRYNAGVKFKLGRYFLEGPGAYSKWKLDQTSPFEKVRVLNPVPDQSSVDAGFKALTDTYPELQSLKVSRKWGGWIDSTPDGIPVISPVAALNGLYLATGFSGHGFGIGPAAGKLAAQMITGEKPIVDPSGFSLERLARGANKGKVAKF